IPINSLQFYILTYSPMDSSTSTDIPTMAVEADTSNTQLPDSDPSFFVPPTKY
ncbi:hypothetical protein M422DRAFT_28967, partial [Sphaerobolus stellatus SS14]